MNSPEHPYHFQNQAEWRAWLEENHAMEKEAWLAIRKQNAAQPGVSYEEALCFEWIDMLGGWR